MNSDIQKYISCMEEIKIRTSLIASFLNNEKTTGYLGTDVEFLCLQFRKILELIAFASITANKDKYAELRKKFAKDWNARLIFQDLEKANPNFYPTPGEQIKDSATGKVVEVKIKSEGFLTRDEFLKAYEKTAGMLHASNPYSTQKDVLVIKSQLGKWLEMIMELLSHHQIQLVDSDKMLWVTMNAIPDGKVHVFQMVKFNK